MKYAKTLYYASIGILFRISKEESLIEWCSIHDFPFNEAEKRIESLEADLAVIRKLQAQESTQ